MDPTGPTPEEGGVSLTKPGDDGVSPTQFEDGVSLTKPSDGGVSPTQFEDGVSLTKPGDGGVSPTQFEDGVSLTKPADGGVSPTQFEDGVSHTKLDEVLVTKRALARSTAGTAPKKVAAAPSLPRPSTHARSSRSRVGPRVLTGAIALVLVSSLVWVFAIRQDHAASTANSRSATVPVASGSPSASNPVVEPTPVATSVPSTTVDPSTRAATATDPASALKLTASGAASQLLATSQQNATLLQPLVGSWAPQVSSKCAGIPVDIQPRWIPDGVTDTQSVTIQQILAFNLSLQQRFGAITVLPMQIGISSDRPGSGACQGQTVWMSIVPNAFTNSKDAAAWCGINVPPADECYVRLVATARGI